MKIDLKQLVKLENQYSNEGPITANILQTMVDIVLQYSESEYDTAPSNVKLAITTLKELRILKEDSEVKQLNS